MATGNTIRVGGVRVDITGNNANMVKAVSGAGRAMRRQGEDLRRLRAQYRGTGEAANELSKRMGGLATAGLAAGFGAAGAAGIAGLAKGAGDLGASLVETSVRANIAVDALQSLGRVAEGDGVATEKLYKSLTALNRAIAQGQDGIATYVREFERLGISVTDLTGLTVDQVFLRLADAVRDTASQADAIQGLSVILGGAGAKLFNVLALGSEELEKQQDYFRSLGVLTDEQAQRLKTLAQIQTDANNQLQTLVAGIVADNAESIAETIQVFSGLAVSLVRTVAPALGAIAQGVRTFAALVDELILAYVVKRALPLLAKAFAGITATIAASTGAMAAFQAIVIATMRKVLAPVLTAVAAFIAVREAIDYITSEQSFGEYMDNVGDRLRAFVADPVDSVLKGLGILNDGVNGFKPPSFEALPSVGGVGLSDDEIESLREGVALRGAVSDVMAAQDRAERDRLSRIAAEREALRANADIISGMVVGSRQQAEGLEFEVFLLDKSLKQRREAVAARRVAVKLSQREVAVRQQLARAQGAENATAIAAAKVALNNLEAIRAGSGALIVDIEANMERAEAATKKLESARELEGLFGDIGQAVGSFAATAVTSFENIGDAARTLAKVIANTLLQRFVAQPIANAVADALGGAVGASVSPVSSRDYEAANRAALLSARTNAQPQSIIVSPTIIGSDEATVRRALSDSVPGIVASAKASTLRDLNRPSQLQQSVRR